MRAKHTKAPVLTSKVVYHSCSRLPGTLFFWSFELLVFMVLLNFLLAIIVDAFSEVKASTSETVGLHTEVINLLADRARVWFGRYFNVHHIPEGRLAALLRQWASLKGGEDEEKTGGKEDDDGDEGDKKIKVCASFGGALCRFHSGSAVKQLVGRGRGGLGGKYKCVWPKY